MASIIDDPNGRRRIQFTAVDGTRKTVRLGKADRKTAETCRGHIEKIIGANIAGGAVPDETSRWLAQRTDAFYARLARTGLVEPRESGRTSLRQLLDAYFAHLNVKPITSLGYQPTKAGLLAYFGADRPIADIRPLEAEQWRAQMKADGLAEATISKRVGIAKHIFRRAVEWQMLPSNPFAHVKAGSQVNKERQRFISRAEAQKVLDACPDAQWRLLFALSRYGGLRCPSEHLALKWADVDWEHGRIRVTCSKTEHHQGRGERFCPIFPELRPYLLAAFEEAEPGTEYVITRYREPNCNLRTQLERIIYRAGLSPWPRLFHNLRSTRQTELTERFPAHVVAAWIGNTERVAQNHYLQVTDTHFAQASAEPKKAAQKAAQQMTAETRKASRPIQKTAIFGQKRGIATPCEQEIAATGLEHPPETKGNTTIPGEGGAKSGAFAAAIAAILALPLSDDEKAQAVRRLLEST